MDDEKEFARRLNTYADGITAFAVLQGVTFCLLIGQNTSLACFLRSSWPVAAVLSIAASVAYLLLIRQCYRGEDKLLGLPKSRGAKIAGVIATIRVIRLCIILTVGLLDFGLVVAVGVLPPLVDCAKVLGKSCG